MQFNRCILVFFFLFVVTLTAQTPALLLSDPCNQAFDKWVYHRDGTVALDKSAFTWDAGRLVIRLCNPEPERECNAGLSDPQNIYGKSYRLLIAEIRLRTCNPMLPGSRGWGFWKAARNGKATSLAWFMEQQHATDKGQSWALAGALAGGKRQIKKVDFNLQSWHTYRIERDLQNKTVRFFVDDVLWFNTPGIAPTERMSFHVWVDNQVYSKSQGIRRFGWQGTSALEIEYVRIWGR